MANGRLGKANLASKASSAVYTNNSGAEASISVIAQSTSGSELHLRIDDSSSSVETSTTLASETYEARFLDYAATNTGFTDPTPAYEAKFMFNDTSVNQNIDQCFEAYVESSTTTYSNKTNTAYWGNMYTIWPYATWLDVWGDKAYHVHIGGANKYNFYAYNTGTINSADAYYSRFIGTNSTDNIRSESATSYYNVNTSWDPWVTDTPYLFSVNVNGYIQSITFETDFSNATTQIQNTSGWVAAVGISSLTQNDANNARPYLRVSNKIVALDACNGNYVAFNCFKERVFDTATSYTTRAAELLENSARKVLRINLNGSNGGKIMYFEYNPTDELHYCGIRRGGASTDVSLFTIDRPTMEAAITNGTTIDFTFDVDQATYGLTWLGSDLSLTLASPYAINDEQVTFRSVFIGTQDSPLWALIVSEIGQQTAPHVYYSTDLKSWTRSTDYYTNDYNKVSGDTTIVSTGGNVTARKTNVGNLALNGVLEYGTSFGQYERTGLVLSNGDRVIAYNSGNNPIAIQVMGYEGS